MATANHVLLRRITLTADASSVTFDSIPQTGYTDLKLQYSVRGTATPAYLYEHIRMSFNGGSSGDYRSKMLYGNGSSAYSADGSGPGSSYAPWAGVFSSNNTTSNTFSSCETYITNYAVAGVEKSFSTDAVSENNATGAAATLTAQRWTGTAAINSITIAASTGNFMAGSSFSLYGIADVNTTPALAPKADGGDIIKTDGTYWYHAFTSSGTFKPQLNLTADVLVVAGGGGSPAAGTGAGPSGGGGAGGILAFTSQALSTTGYTCSVGAGGASTTGTDSQFGSLTLVKGGGIGGVTDAIGGTGGSGGGSGGRYTSAGGAATSGQGSAGGIGYQQSGLASGAGGGAGAVGGAAGNNTGGTGGAGTNTYSAWTTATGTGVSNYLAAGGGGMSWYSGSGGAGGTGGGGTGASTSTGNATNGTANTGSGGGGSSYGSTGGSGIIIIRYPV